MEAARCWLVMISQALCCQVIGEILIACYQHREISWRAAPTLSFLSRACPFPTSPTGAILRRSFRLLPPRAVTSGQAGPVISACHARDLFFLQYSSKDNNRCTVRSDAVVARSRGPLSRSERVT